MCGRESERLAEPHAVARTLDGKDRDDCEHQGDGRKRSGVIGHGALSGTWADYARPVRPVRSMRRSPTIHGSIRAMLRASSMPR